MPLPELSSREMSASLDNLVLSREAAWLLVRNQEQSKADFLPDLLKRCFFSSALPEPFASCSLSKPLPGLPWLSHATSIKSTCRTPKGSVPWQSQMLGKPKPLFWHARQQSLPWARRGSFANRFNELWLHTPCGESTREDYYTAALALEQESRIRERKQDVSLSSPRHHNPCPAEESPAQLRAPSPIESHLRGTGRPRRPLPHSAALLFPLLPPGGRRPSRQSRPTPPSRFSPVAPGPCSSLPSRLWGSGGLWGRPTGLS